ncbi:hypothetical protein DEJ48_21225 [Streptomyces venezuelae]|uniref:Uncharacterized protein n=2 Tax=Streptomyces venezuelae TaxID=54571 RepID=A0A5P2BYP1_STRVZ|nr:hypothetical protein DEJ48_21225 [Streptomyces venezuelae]
MGRWSRGFTGAPKRWLSMDRSGSVPQVLTYGDAVAAQATLPSGETLTLPCAQSYAPALKMPAPSKTAECATCS